MAGSDLHPRHAEIVAAARGCLGAGFRPSGRGGAGGFDCLGLALAAAGGAGLQLDPGPLPMRGFGIEQALALLTRLGFGRRMQPDGLAGDLLVAGPAARQVHLAIRTGPGFIEANARLRRVVEHPLPGGAWHSAWQLPLE